MIRKKLLANPPVVFLAVWTFIILLFHLRLSTRLAAPMGSIYQLVLLFGLGYCSGAIVSLFLSARSTRTVSADFPPVLWRHGANIIYVLLALSAVEVAIEGYIPSVAMAMNRNISHLQFGIDSVHGLIIAGLTAVGSVFFTVFCFTGDRMALKFAFVPVLYSILFVSRKMFTVCFIQYLLIYFYARPISVKSIIIGVLCVLSFIFAFGAFGDLRGRSSIIDDYGGFDSRFDFVGDTGFRWVYLYVTTPLENLSYTTRHYPSEKNLLFTRTYESLVPSAVSRAFTGEVKWDEERFRKVAVSRYWLQSPVFNVSTGFNEPYLDNGLAGIFIQAAIMGFLSMFTFLNHRDAIGFSVFIALISGSLLSVFSNTFGNLNYIGQFLFYFVMRYPLKFRSVAPKAMRDDSNL